MQRKREISIQKFRTLSTGTAYRANNQNPIEQLDQITTDQQYVDQFTKRKRRAGKKGHVGRTAAGGVKVLAVTGGVCGDQLMLYHTLLCHVSYYNIVLL